MKRYVYLGIMGILILVVIVVLSWFKVVVLKTTFI